jgi:hypothetical protein
MPPAYRNDDGELVKRCVICDHAKPASSEYFHSQRKNGDGFHSFCKVCKQSRTRLLDARRRDLGLKIKEAFIRSIGSKCQYPGCHMRYPDDLPGNFDLDHVDPRLKQTRETSLAWMAGNEKEFWERVAPNLRLLCCHHHRVITGEQFSFGGEWHQMLHGTADPAHMFNIPQDNHLVLFEWKASGGAACPTL